MSDMLDASWTLHPQLAADATNVCDLSLSRVLAINAADYPWLILVPRRPGAVEIADLGDEASLLMREMTRASRALTDITRCDKLNVAAIGNVVPQLHVHIIARWKSDPLWPKPVWGVSHAAAPSDTFARFLDAVRSKLDPTATDPPR
jgi:diadenosine tetraphosphate (Ap4A) HIT family hydrolase